jgi:hypothetical protein
MTDLICFMQFGLTERSAVSVRYNGKLCTFQQQLSLYEPSGWPNAPFLWCP